MTQVQCPKCGYDLAGILLRDRFITCPECGGVYAPVDLVPIRTTLRSALISGVAPWAAVLVLVFVLPMAMGLEGAGGCLWEIALVAAALSISLTTVLLVRSWRRSIWFDRGAVITIVGIANGFGLFFTYWVSVVLEGAGC